MDHLPECPAPLCDYFDPKGKCMGYEDCEHLCCCAALRACEQRVRMEDDDYAYVSAQAEADGRRRGWSEALDAAREAVVALKPRLKVEKYKGGYDCCGCSTTYDLMEDALAAIDALKEKP